METKLRKEGFENDEASISVRIQQCTGDRGREIPGGRCNFCAEHMKAGKLDEGYLSRTRSDLRRR